MLAQGGASVLCTAWVFQTWLSWSAGTGLKPIQVTPYILSRFSPRKSVLGGTDG